MPMVMRSEPMVSSHMNVFLHQLRAALGREVGDVTDAELLTRFLKQRDEAALASLVQRHARMVWGVCCRILQNRHDAEDAFQATFLVLVRKAAGIQDKALFAGWLYGVAQQTAVRLRAMAAKQGLREKQVMNLPEPAQAAPAVDDLLPLLDQELSRLPEQFRTLIVLCDLEGKSRKEAAEQLGCPEGTVASRLARARAMLAKRFSRHGQVVSGAVLVPASASAAPPASVVASAIEAVTLVASGQVVSAGLFSAKIVALTEGVVKAMFVSKIKSVLSVVLVAGVALGGAGVGLGLSTSGVAVAQSATTPRVALAPPAPPEPPRSSDVQKKELENQLQQLRKQLREVEARRATEEKKAVESEELKQPAVLLLEFETNDPAIEALQGLLKSSDPKVAAQAKALLALLAEKSTPPTGERTFLFELVPPAKPKAVELEWHVDGPKLDAGKHKLLFSTDAVKPGNTAPGGASSLKLSADGKTAAVVGADGTITLYDVASGKEQMKFPIRR